MNAKQSLKIVSQKLQDAEMVVRQAERDILYYNRCINALIAGYSPCPWCEEFLECDKEEKTLDHVGCSDWWLAYDVDKNMEAVKNDTENTGDDTTGGAAGGTCGGSDGDGTGCAEVPENPDAIKPDPG